MKKVNLDALKLLLFPKGLCPLIGEESGEVLHDGVSKLVNPHGSIRYQYAIEGRIVSALQIMVNDSGVVATNVFTDPEFQRQRLACELAFQAMSDFPDLKFSEERSEAGAAWVENVEILWESESRPESDVADLGLYLNDSPS